MQLIEDQARRIESQRDDYIFTLNYEDYLTERRKKKKYLINLVFLKNINQIEL